MALPAAQEVASSIEKNDARPLLVLFAEVPPNERSLHWAYMERKLAHIKNTMYVTICMYVIYTYSYIYTYTYIYTYIHI